MTLLKLIVHCEVKRVIKGKYFVLKAMAFKIQFYLLILNKSVMKNKIHPIMAFTMLSALFLFNACENEAKHHDLSTTDIQLVINSPTDTQEFEADDTVFINATIDAPSELHGYELHLKRLADTTEVLSKDIDLHTNHFSINEIYINPGLVHSDMELEIVAKIDHNGKSTSKKVHFHCHEK